MTAICAARSKSQQCVKRRPHGLPQCPRIRPAFAWTTAHHPRVCMTSTARSRALVTGSVCWSPDTTFATAAGGRRVSPPIHFSKRHFAHVSVGAGKCSGEKAVEAVAANTQNLRTLRRRIRELTCSYGIVFGINFLPLRQ